jgi:AcrR family transcriptional regulator
VPRWEPDGVERLQAAAFELFAEQGFERTTVAEIAERAGLTKRTFFNHFADKREVLFGPNSELQREIVTREIAACPDTLPPLDAVVRGLQAAAETLFEPIRDAVARRRDLVEANPELRERELGKRAALTDAIAATLQARGLDADTALLTARAGVLVQQTAMQRWTTTQAAEARPLRELLSDALLSLRTIVGGDSGDGNGEGGKE